jgi:hypothetical protein
MAVVQPQRNTPPRDGCGVSCLQTTSVFGLSTLLSLAPLRPNKFATSNHTIPGILRDVPTAIENILKNSVTSSFWKTEVLRKKLNFSN